MLNQKLSQVKFDQINIALNCVQKGLRYVEVNTTSLVEVVVELVTSSTLDSLLALLLVNSSRVSFLLKFLLSKFLRDP